MLTLELNMQVLLTDVEESLSEAVESTESKQYIHVNCCSAGKVVVTGQECRPEVACTAETAVSQVRH